MDVEDILSEATLHGLSLSVEGGKLAMRSDSTPPESLRASIREHAAGIIAHLELRDRQDRLSHLSPASSLAPAELFADNLRKGLLRHSEILDRPVDPKDFRMVRIISDTATSVIGIAARAAESTLRPPRDMNRQPSARLLEAVARADREED
jgi:hypothetical protein